MGGFFKKPMRLKGLPTMCAHCGALLVFADEQGRVRAMTETERDSVQFAPIVAELYATWRAKISEDAGKYTRTSFN